MSQQKNFPLSTIDLIIDGIGMILLVIGYLDWSQEKALVPENLQFANYPIILMVIGGILVTSVLLKLLKSKRNNKNK